MLWWLTAILATDQTSLIVVYANLFGLSLRDFNALAAATLILRLRTDMSRRCELFEVPRICSRQSYDLGSSQEWTEPDLLTDEMTLRVAHVRFAV